MNMTELVPACFDLNEGSLNIIILYLFLCRCVLDRVLLLAALSSGA